MIKDWKKYKIGQILFRQKDSFNLNELESYKRLTIRTNGGGISLRDTAKGYDIGTKRQFYVKKHQFLISKIDAMNGAYGIIPEECDGGIITGNFWTYEYDNNLISQEYLELLSIGQVFTEFSKKASTGTTNRKYLDETKFYELEILLPSLNEQNLITGKINSVKTSITEIESLNKQQAKETKKLKYSLYTDLIKGAKLKQMKKVAPINRYKVDIDAETTYHEIGVRSFGRGTFEKPSFKGSDLTWQKPYWMKKGDLLFSNIKAWEGAVALLGEKEDGKVGSHRYITCTPNEELIEGEYLLYYLLLPQGIEQLSLCSPGTADRNRTLNTKKLEAIEVPVPAIEEQRKFVALLHQFKQIEKQHVEREKELSELIPSLLDKAFKGELVCNKEKENIAIAAEPKASYTKVESLIPKNKRGFAKQVLGGKIVSLFKDDKNFTNIKFQKLQYLAEHIAEEDLNWNYYKQSAGPYDNKFMHTVFNKLKQNQWFSNRNYKFHSLEKSDKIDSYYQGYFGSKAEKLSELFNLLRNASEKFCEAVATIYAVWNNHVILEQPFDKTQIKKDFFEWSNRKEMIFSEEEFEKALVWMNKHHIVPTGFGNLIKEKK